MKKLIVGQLIISVIVLIVFYAVFSWKGDMAMSLFFAAAITIGAAGAALLGLLAPYTIGSAGGVFAYSVVTHAWYAVIVAGIATIAAAFFATQSEIGKAGVSDRALATTSSIQFIIVTAAIAVIQGGVS